MNRTTRRRARRGFSLALLLSVALGVSSLVARPVLAQSDAEITGWRTELQNAPKADAASAKAAYGALLEKLLPGMSSGDYGTQARTQDAWEKIALNAGRPGAEAERLGAVQAMLDKIGPATPQLARIWLIKQLEHIGRAESVPALAALINETDVAVRGRVLRALAANTSPEAGAALRDALGKATTPEMRVALINDIGYRRDAGATAQLAALLTGDENVAQAAAAALGRIGTADAAKALTGARAGAASPKLKTALQDAALLAADRMAGAGQKAPAIAIYQQVWAAPDNNRLKAWALRGVALNRGAEALPVLIEQMNGDDAYWQLTAARLLTELPADAGGALAKQLPNLKPGVQVMVLEAVSARRDPAARPAVLALAKGADGPVKLAALRSLAALGTADDVEMLAQLAAGQGDVATTARASLDRLPGEAINTQMVNLFLQSKPEVRAVLASSLAARRAQNAGTAMLAAAEKGAPAERIEAIKALGVLGNETIVPNLVKLLAKAPDDAQRTATQGALRDIIDNRTQDKAAAGSALATGLAGADAAGKKALLTLMRNTGGDAALQAAVAASKDADAEVQDTAIRTLAAWPEASAAPTLKELAANAPKASYQVFAVQGLTRLASLPSLGNDEKLKLLGDALTLAKRPDEKRGALSALGKITDPDALTLVLPLLDNADLKEEASLAVVGIAKGVSGDAVKAALQKVVETSKNADTVKAATDLINRPSVVRSWQILGPFPGDGAFDKDFGVERGALDLNKAYTLEGKKTARFKTVLANPETGYVNLLDHFDTKENAAAYAVIYVKSPDARKAHLSGGSDDGLKLWLNGKQIIANNAARAANPNDEHADVDLKAGWNEIKLKITQGGGDWGYYLDLQTLDKKPMTDLMWSAKPN